MPRSELLQLTLGLQRSLVQHIGALRLEVDRSELDPDGIPYLPLALPKPMEGSTSIVGLGIRTEMLSRDLEVLPAMSCGIYIRKSIMELERPLSHIRMPYSVDVYLGGISADRMYIQALKWALVMDLWHERFGDQVVPGWQLEEAPDIDISYELELSRAGEFRQLVTITGIFTSYE